MTLDEVPADTIMELTPELDRVFKTAKCNPTCHACVKKIQIGSNFQLLALNNVDEMLCSSCTKQDLEAKHERDRKARIRESEALEKHRDRKMAQGRSGYSRPSKETQ